MNKRLALDELLWPCARLSEAIAAAAASLAAGTSNRPGCRGPAAASIGDGESHGAEIDPVEIPWSALGQALGGLGPAVLQVAGPVPGHLVLLRRGRRGLLLVAPDGSRHAWKSRGLAAVLRRDAEDRRGGAVEELLAALPVSGRRRRCARQAFLTDLLVAEPGTTTYVLGAPACRPFAAQLLGGHLPRQAMALVAALGASQALALLSWYLLGRGLLAGRLERSWMLAWALLLVTLPLMRAVELAATARLGHRMALLLRRRLLDALLALDAGGFRGEGTGRLLGRLLAAESLERVLLGGGPAALLALVELGAATSALALGAAARLQLVLEAVALAAMALLFFRYGRAPQACGACRLELTAELVEAMAGHRTRLAQGGGRGGRQADAREDGALAAYHSVSRRLGRLEALLRTGLARAWQLGAVGALVPAVTIAGAAPGRLAASLGGILLARSALGRLAAALCDAAAARSHAGEILPILSAEAPRGVSAGRRGGRTSPAEACEADAAVPEPGGGADARDRLVEARGLEVHVGEGPQRVVAAGSFDIGRGERVVLDGPSGAGKSTLAAVLAAHRLANGGLLLLAGLDLPSVGVSAWRRRVVAVPQLHANYLFADTLAFNLLLGRGWPPAPRDLADADALCLDLGLGGLLDRLPAGLEQRIGEAGWLLSDGEASRVCLARALLQEPELLILDESLAALDPETRLRVLAVASRRARSLVVVAHA